jgi:hypothetical protein
MLTEAWHRLLERRARRERLEDEAAIENALREQDDSHSESRRSNPDHLPPPFKNTDWIPPGP